MALQETAVKDVVKQGFLLLLPIGISFFVIKFMFDTLDGVPQSLIEMAFGYKIPGLGLFIILIFSFLLGLVVATVVGRNAYNKIEGGMTRIPFFGQVYNVAKLVISSSSSNDGMPIVTVEYPSEGLCAIGFITKYLGDNKVMVYLPSTPVPNTGILIIAPKEKVTKLNISTGDAIRIITSAGVVSPDSVIE
jgi:uncharacterized membrane protein